MCTFLFKLTKVYYKREVHVWEVLSLLSVVKSLVVGLFLHHWMECVDIIPLCLFDFECVLAKMWKHGPAIKTLFWHFVLKDICELWQVVFMVPVWWMMESGPLESIVFLSVETLSIDDWQELNASGDCQRFRANCLNISTCMSILFYDMNSIYRVKGQLKSPVGCLTWFHALFWLWWFCLPWL